MPFNVKAQLQPTNVVNFGGGLNIKTAATEIADNESPNMSNIISDVHGASFKRRGSEKFVEQAISSFPVLSMYRAYGSTGTVFKKALIIANNDSIYFSSKDISPQWLKISSGLTVNQRYEFESINNRVIIAGDKLENPMLQFDIVNASMNRVFASTGAPLSGSTSYVTVFQNLRAKYIVNAKNHMIYGNVRLLTDGSTYYPSRIYYSYFLEPSSVVANALIDYRADDGQEITGLGNMQGRTHIFKETTIAELDFNTLDANPSIGDQQIETLVDGFGVIAPKTLVNIGQFYVFLARDGIRIWDGGRRQRLTLSEESAIISLKIQPIIDRIIRVGTYKNAVAIYYPKKQWYVFAYEDPDLFPKNANNSVLIYDFNLGMWFPFKNWLVGSLEVLDASGDLGTLLYGSSIDGYVYKADVNEQLNDARKELVFESMNSTFSWVGSSYNFTNVVEGTASLKLTVSASVTESSMTIMKTFSVGEWNDKTKVTKNDKISFKIYPDSIGFISSIRIDFEVNDVISSFDTNFTSVTISSSALSAGNTAFSTIEIALSSFPILQTWIELDSELVPFADTLTFYGFRFVLSGTNDSSISIDDVRIVQRGENSLNAFRDTKQFDLESSQIKDFDKMLLTYSKSPEASFTVEFAKDFGQTTTRRSFAQEFGKSIFVFGYDGRNGITKLSSIDFEEEISTQVQNQNIFDAMTGTSDNDKIYWGDRTINRIMNVSRSSMSVDISSFGSLGTGSTNFDLPHQIAVDNTDLWIVDNRNNRIKRHRKPNGEFISMFGTLGRDATSFHNPTGIAVDDVFVYVGDDSNYKITKLTKSSYGVVNIEPLDFNTAGEMTLAVDSKFFYLAYNKISDLSLDHQDIFLESRDKNTLDLVNRVSIKPKNFIGIVSSGSLRGDIAQVGPYIYLSFTNDFLDNGTFFLQKRLKEGFGLVKEKSFSRRNFGIAGNGLAWKPEIKRDEIETGLFGRYLQAKFSENELDNDIKLFNMSFYIKSHIVR